MNYQPIRFSKSKWDREPSVASSAIALWENPLSARHLLPSVWWLWNDMQHKRWTWRTHPVDVIHSCFWKSSHLLHQVKNEALDGNTFDELKTNLSKFFAFSMFHKCKHKCNKLRKMKIQNKYNTNIWKSWNKYLKIRTKYNTNICNLHWFQTSVTRHNFGGFRGGLPPSWISITFQKVLEIPQKVIGDSLKGLRDSLKGLRDSSKGLRDSSKGLRDSSKGLRGSLKGLRGSSKGHWRFLKRSLEIPPCTGLRDSLKVFDFKISLLDLRIQSEHNCT